VSFAAITVCVVSKLVFIVCYLFRHGLSPETLAAAIQNVTFYMFFY
jgi:uncharacterized membrane protein YozB (DUF420 family)